jgi:hypothetical protein
MSVVWCEIVGNECGVSVIMSVVYEYEYECECSMSVV